MRPGTPQFIGERLREAREARGMTQITLAELLGISNRAVSQYEKGLASPHPDIMKIIPDKLTLPSQFFFTPLPPKEEETVIFYRSLRATTAAARTQSEGKYRWLKEMITDYLEKIVEFPSVNFPDWPFPKDPLQIQDKDIEIAATALRKSWGLGEEIISNTVYLLENNGAIVTKINIGTQTIDSFSNWRAIGRRPYVILGAEKGSASRLRMDVAHELGHMVLHRNVGKDDFKKRDTFKRIEEQAFKFAGAFLMPLYSFASDFSGTSLNALQSLKMRWKVSMSAMIIRARDIGLISEEQENNFWRSYGRKGYRRYEPLDNEISQEEPAVLQQTFKMIIEKRVRTREYICSSIPLSPRDIEELACLPKSYLNNRPEPKILDINKVERKNTEAVSNKGKILTFRRKN